MTWPSAMAIAWFKVPVFKSLSAFMDVLGTWLTGIPYLTSPQSWTSSVTPWMDISHKHIWFFDLFDHGNLHPTPSAAASEHSFIRQTFMVHACIPDSVLKMIKNTVLSLSPKSLRSRRGRGQGKFYFGTKKKLQALQVRERLQKVTVYWSHWCHFCWLTL